ncbi:hypothetical protein ACMSIO_24090 [Pseudomonas benzopyrenica]|uniref:hypothetical protein n=1 Tax=Pseudomonas benzopyrenica TaxID=2993566 RepID=UPI0039C2CC5D
MKDKCAILIFEGVWNLYDSDINRSSVLPFFEGLAKTRSDIEVIHTRFYDDRSFKSAFKALTTDVSFKNAIVYVSAHGDGKRIGEAKIVDIMVKCNLESRAANITGVVLGSCFSAGTERRPVDETIKCLIQDSRLAWVSSYRCAGNWLEGTLIDLCLIKQMLLIGDKVFESEQDIVENLAEGIACFSPHSNFGWSSDEDALNLKESLAFFAQPRGQGHRAKCITESVWLAWDELQLGIEVVDL